MNLYIYKLKLKKEWIYDQSDGAVVCAKSALSAIEIVALEFVAPHWNAQNVSVNLIGIACGDIPEGIIFSHHSKFND